MRRLLTGLALTLLPLALTSCKCPPPEVEVTVPEVKVTVKVEPGGTGTGATESGSPTVHSSLVIPTHMSAVHQKIDNGLKWPRSQVNLPANTVDKGLMIQLGGFHDTDFGDPPNSEAPFRTDPAVAVLPDPGVTIRFKDDSELTLSLEQFHWIDLIAEGTYAGGRSEHPIELLDALKMLPDRPDHPGVPGVTGTEFHPSGDLSVPGQAVPWTDYRRRSLHSVFEPQALITYWMGTNGYRVVATRGHEGDVRQTLEFLDPVQVRIKFDRGNDPTIEDRGELRELIISRAVVDGDPSHGGLHDPPVGGGAGGGAP